jgi:hypothetical protein
LIPSCRCASPQPAHHHEQGDNHLDYYNGLGQLIERKQAASDKSKMTISHYTYNAQGLKEYEYVPYITTTYSPALRRSARTGQDQLYLRCPGPELDHHWA